MWLRLSAFLMLAYPLVAPFFLWIEKPIYLVYLLAAILVFLSLDRIQHKDIVGSTLTLFSLAVIYTFYVFNSAALLVYIPPVLIPFGLFLLFNQSLDSQKTPLITKYAEIMDGSLDSERRDYTRKLTKIWRALFLFLVIESILLAIFAVVEVWALFTHVINYLVILLLFAGEFIYRRYRFGKSSVSFWVYMKKISNLRPRDIMDGK